MRLINNVPVRNLCNLTLSRENFGTAKTFIATAEKLKISEQKLNFFKRCKRQQVFPVFMLNSTTFNQSSLFPMRQNSGSVSRYQHRLRTLSLQQHISYQYQFIADRKRDLVHLKDNLFHKVDHSTFISIATICEEHQRYVKQHYKDRLQKKFSWLLEKYYPPTPPPPPTTTQPADDRVTTLNTDSVSEQQKSVLALGPNFAVCPRIDQSFKDKVAVDIAQCVFKIRHKHAITQRANSDTSAEVSTPIEPTEESSSSKVRRLCPFPSPFTSTPDPTHPVLEDKLAQFNRFVQDLVSNTNPQDNLTRFQKDGLRSLLTDRTLHVSVSDKCGEFVVTTKDTHRHLTENHLQETAVYQRVLPTRKINGRIVSVAEPTSQQLTQLIKKKTENLVKESNNLRKKISSQRNLDDDYKRRIRVPDHVSLPVMYVQIKTRKNPPERFRSTIPLEQVKVRPIISCVDSPTERLSWLVTSILKPLLNKVPSHLSNLIQHIEMLRQISQEQLARRKFFVADISALYTNINVQGCIDDVIELATEHQDSLDLMGLSLTDIHEILLHILTNSFFVYNRTLWLQQDGLFMGLRPGPFCAIIRVYKFEKNSIYTDQHYLSVYLSNFYKRYIDDAASTAETKEEALALVQQIADQDPDKKLKWEVDFPEQQDDFIPFLNTEVRIEPNGQLTSRLYRKPQQKDITLHNNSCHPESVKINTVKNLYSEACRISSGPAEKEHSLRLLDDLQGVPHKV